MSTQIQDNPQSKRLSLIEVILILFTLVMLIIMTLSYLGIDPRPITKQLNLPTLDRATVMPQTQGSGNVPVPTRRGASAPAAPAIPAATPIPGICQDQACADAAYRDAVQAAEQAAGQPVIEHQPVIVQERTFERQAPPPAGEAPMAEPVQEGGPINIQETHQCRHGQVWIDGAGCKNPPSDKGSKQR